MSAFFYAIRCTCGCIHGWINHPAVRKVTRESRTAMEHLWYCPACGRQHRTTDGTIMGQLRKEYVVITREDDLPPVFRHGMRIVVIDGVVYGWEEHA